MLILTRRDGETIHIGNDIKVTVLEVKSLTINLKTTLIALLMLSVTGCATIVNDPMIPVTATFSDGSDGTCEFQNKRGLWKSDIPDTAMIRRSDDPLVYRCETKDGRKASGMIESKIEGEKLGASALLSHSLG